MNYIKHYNVVIREVAGLNAKPEFPNHYDKRLFDAMQPEKKTKYWAHLRGLGYKPKKVAGKVVDWVKAQQTNTNKEKQRVNEFINKKSEGSTKQNTDTATAQ